MKFPILASVMETYTRQIRVGDSYAMCGPRFIVALMRPFTTGEDAVSLWCRLQDDTRVLDIVPLRDGRDFIVFERLHKNQSLADAYEEARAFESAMLRHIPRQHATSDTPTMH